MELRCFAFVDKCLAMVKSPTHCEAWSFEDTVAEISIVRSNAATDAMGGGES